VDYSHWKYLNQELNVIDAFAETISSIAENGGTKKCICCAKKFNMRL
jgi:hypothetical protein